MDSLQQDIITGTRFFGAVALIVLAAVLALVNRGKVQSKVYNQSRWLLVAGSLVLGTHNIIQFIGHFRETTVSTAWLINIMTYIFVLPTYNLAELNLLRSGHQMYRSVVGAVSHIIVCIVLFIIGYATNTLINDEYPHKTMTCAIAVFFCVQLIYMSIRLSREMRMIKYVLNDTELHNRHTALRYTATSIRLIILFSLFTPWMGISDSLWLHSIIGTIIFILFAWFVASFCLYGANMSEVIEVAEEIREAEITTKENSVIESSENNEEPEDTDCQRIAPIVTTWIKGETWLNPNMNLDLALAEMCISLRLLNKYIHTELNQEGYRQWISSMRIEKAKELFQEHPEYSIETISSMCGFLDRSNFSRSFKSHVGVSPSVWISSMNTKTP